MAARLTRGGAQGRQRCVYLRFRPKRSQNGHLGAPKGAFQANADKSACRGDRSLPCGAQNAVFIAQGSTKSRMQSRKCIRSHEGSTHRGKKGARMRRESGTNGLAGLQREPGGPKWAHLGPFSASLEALLAHLGRSLTHLDAFLSGFHEHFCTFAEN